MVVTVIIKNAAGNIRSDFSFGKINVSAQAAISTVVNSKINFIEMTFSIAF